MKNPHLALLLSLLATAACGSSGPVTFERLPPAAARADFTLEDLNPSSATFSRGLGPSLFRGSVSAWYFGEST